MTQMIILGAKRSKGVLENGNTYDSTKLYIQTAMKDNPDQIGFGVAEYNWGDSTNFYSLKDYTFPLKADVQLDVVTNGRTNQIIVTSVELPKPQPKVS